MSYHTMQEEKARITPCKYTVIRYVPNIVRDEPINIGVIVQSQKTLETESMFITDFKYRHLEDRLDINPEFLKELTETIRQIYLNKADPDLLNNLASSLPKTFGNQVRLTPPRVTMASDLNREKSELFETFISVKYLREFEREITHKRIQVDVFEYVSNYNDRLRKNYTLKGSKSSFEFALAVIEQSRFLHTISFDELYASKNAKILDWSVSDIISQDRGLRQENFGAIIARPLKSNPRYEAKMEEYDEGMKILGNGKYELVIYDKDSEEWKNQVKKLLA